MNNVKNFEQFLNKNTNIVLKKGDKVLINSVMMKDNIEFFEKLLKKALKKQFNKKIHCAGEKYTEVYNRSLNGDIATVTSVENSISDSAFVNLIFDDGFEFSTTKKTILKIVI